MRALRLLALLSIVLALPLAAAQGTSPVLIERLDDGELVADVGSAATATFSLLNLNAADDHYIDVKTEGPDGWTVDVSQTRFYVPPRQTAVVNVTFSPDVSPHEMVEFTLTFAISNARTGETAHIEETVEVASGAAPRVIGILPNPLSPPFDNAYGTFMLDMLVWIVVGVVSVFVGRYVARVAMMRAREATTSAIVDKLRRPVFLLIILLGLSRSFAILPRNPITVFISKFLIAIAVTVFGLYVMYRGLEAALIYYQREIAPKTATKMDDVLVPAFRKVGLIIIYVAGTIITLRQLGWDPTLIFAGAGIAGLVVAFAAQDTFSNLFSGVFLMLDRPFVEGDIILLETGEVARVEHIGLRTTQLYEYDHHHTITVPNNQLATKRVVNYSAPDSLFRVDIFVSVGYGSDHATVERILRETAEADPEVVKLAGWAPAIGLREFADSGMTYLLRVTISDPRDRGRIPSRLRVEIKRRFDEAGIEIPFPQRVLHVKHADDVRALNQND